jgi:hypothetical protein
VAKDADPERTDEEIAKNRDEVIRRMLNTPPQPRNKPAYASQGPASKANTRSKK